MQFAVCRPQQTAQSRSAHIDREPRGHSFRGLCDQPKLFHFIEEAPPELVYLPYVPQSRTLTSTVIGVKGFLSIYGRTFEIISDHGSPTATVPSSLDHGVVRGNAPVRRTRSLPVNRWLENKGQESAQENQRLTGKAC